MSICANCKAKLTCGCQKRIASNGAHVCSNCIASYEASLGIIRQATPPSNPESPPVSGNTMPNNITIKYNPPNRLP